MRHVGQRIRNFNLFSSHTSWLGSTFFFCYIRRVLGEVPHFFIITIMPLPFIVHKMELSVLRVQNKKTEKLVLAIQLYSNIIFFIL